MRSTDSGKKAMKVVHQDAVMWVKAKNGKSGYLALRSDPSKAFSGKVVGIKKGTTASGGPGSSAIYVNGRNTLKSFKEGGRTKKPGSAMSPTVSAARSQGAARGKGAGTRGVTSGTVSGTVSAQKKADWAKNAPKPGEYTPSASWPSSKGNYTPTGVGPKSSRSRTSATVSSAKATSRPSSRYTSSATVSTAKSKGSKRPVDYRQTRWSM